MVPEVDLSRINKFVVNFLKLGAEYSTTREPNTFDCYSFCQLAQKELFDRQMDDIYLGDNLKSWIKAAIKYREQFGMLQLESPVHGCFIEMTHSNRPYHVGIWLDINGGAVMHFTKYAGFQFQTFTELKLSGWRQFIYDGFPD